MALVEDRALAHKLDMSTVHQPMAVSSPQRKPHLQHRQGSDTARVSGQESISDPQRAQPTAMETSAASPELPPRMTSIAAGRAVLHTSQRRRSQANRHRPILRVHAGIAATTGPSGRCFYTIQSPPLLIVPMHALRQPINSLFYPPQRGGGISL